MIPDRASWDSTGESTPREHGWLYACRCNNLLCPVTLVRGLYVLFADHSCLGVKFCDGLMLPVLAVTAAGGPANVVLLC